MTAHQPAPFLGTGWSFPPLFDSAQGQVATISGAADVAESLLLLLSTSPGERPMNPTFGCNLHQFVFAEIDENVLTKLSTEVQNSIETFEPRVRDVQVNSTEDATTPGLLSISVEYTVRSTNSRYNLVFPYHLQEGAHAPMFAHAR